MPTATRRGRQLYSVAKTMALTAVGIDGLDDENLVHVRVEMEELDEAVRNDEPADDPDRRRHEPAADVAPELDDAAG